MNIVYITTGLSTGGAEVMLHHLLSKIDRSRFSPAVVSLMDRGTWGDRIESLDIPIYTIGLRPGEVPTPATVSCLFHTVRKLQPDLIQGWMYHGNLAGQLVCAAFSHKPPVLWNIQHSIYSTSLEKRMTAWVIRISALLSKLPHKIIYVSQIAKTQHEALGYYSERGCVIPNAANPLLFAPSAEARLDVRTELDLPAETILVGLICRYHPMKDHANFLQAAALLSKDFPDVHFVLVGTEVDLKNQALYSLVNELELLKKVHLLGERQDISRLTAALDIASSSSAYGEGSPLILGEAMSAGVPCVVTDVGDSAWMVGDTGAIVPPRNPIALADAWKELISLGSTGREALGKAARTRAIENFGLDSIVARYEALYETAIKEESSRKA